MVKIDQKGSNKGQKGFNGLKLGLPGTYWHVLARGGGGGKEEN